MHDQDRPRPEAETFELASTLTYPQSSPWRIHFPDTHSKLALIELADESILSEPTESIIKHPEQVLLSAMRYGTLELFLHLEQAFGKEAFRLALNFANTKNLDAPSWSYWQYRLQIIETSETPPNLPHG